MIASTRAMLFVSLVQVSCLVGAASCDNTKIKQDRVICYDALNASNRTGERSKFGSVTGVISFRSLDNGNIEGASRARVTIIHYPAIETIAKLNSSYSDQVSLELALGGLLGAKADGFGKYHISQVPVGRHLSIIFSKVFTMQPGHAEQYCHDETGGILKAAGQPQNMLSCEIITVTGGEETIVSKNFEPSLSR